MLFPARPGLLAILSWLLVAALSVLYAQTPPRASSCSAERHGAPILRVVLTGA